MTFGTPYVKQFTSTGDSDLLIRNSSNNPGAAGDTGGGANVLQNPRLVQNVQIVTDATAPAPSGYSSTNKLIRVYSRAAPAAEGKTTSGWWSCGGFQLLAGEQKYGRYTFSLRLSPGKNTKGVVLLWPMGSNSNGWLNAPPGTGNEEDIVETFWQNGGTTDKGVGASNLHYRAADGTVKGSYQLHLPLGVSDWTTWHTVVFTWLPTSLDLTIDGVEAPGYPVTASKYIPQTKMYFAMQTALLVDTGSTRSSTSRTTGYFDMSYVKIEPWSQVGNTAPSVPQNLVANPTSTTKFTLTYNASTDAETSVASYQAQYKTTAGSTWTTLSPVTGLTQSVTTAGPASTSYDFQIQAFDTQGLGSGWSPTYTASTLASGTAPTASLSITPATGYAPLTVTVDPTGTTGSPTSVTLDMGDGNPNNGGVPYSWSSLPAAFSYTYASVGQYTATLVVTNASGTDQALAVTNALDSTNNQTTTPNLGLSLIKSGDSGRSLRAPYNANMTAIDTAIDAISGIQVNNDPSTVVIGGQITGESYPRFVITTDGSYYVGDGTFDPTTATPSISYGGTAPSGTTTFSASNSNNSGTSGSTSVTVTLPSTIATGSIAVFAVEVHAATSISTPSGWTQITSSPVDNSNGNDRLAVFYKTVSGTDAGTTITSTLGASNLWCCGVCVYNTGTGADVTGIAANSGTAQTNHPSPSVTTTHVNEVVVGIVAGRFSTTTAKTITAPSGANQRVQDYSQSTSTNNVSICMFDYTQAAAGATSIGNATTSQGMFSNAATVALTHP